MEVGELLPEEERVLRMHGEHLFSPDEYSEKDH
jgi:hypothetical protein